MEQEIRIECLFAPGCGSREHTLALAAEVAESLGLDAKIEETVISTAEDAARCRFLGSPSVRVNGRDIEPGADDRTDFGMG